MKRPLAIAAFVLIAAPGVFASYVVVLKDGTQYKAKQRWTVSNGKALISLESGGVLQFDPTLIDTQKTDEVNRLGLGNVKVLAVGTPAPASSAPERSDLGSMTKLRKPQPRPPSGSPLPGNTPNVPPPPAPSDPVAPRPGALDTEVISKFEAAYENVRIFEHNVTSPGPGRLVVKLTTDNEDRVFDAITATAFFMTGVPKSTGQNIDLVELYMQTTNGMAAGRFHMRKPDAEAINSKKLTPSAYFIQTVLY